MAKQVVVGIDLGTTGCRAAAFDQRGTLLATSYLEYGVTHPEPGAAEQEAEGWWSAARQCVRAVAGELSPEQSVVALGLSTQGHTWVPTNADFRPLRPALTWLDTRAAAQARELLQSRGAHFWGQRAGKAPGPWHMLPQILWLRSVEPLVVAEASYYLFAQDFLMTRLVGQPVTDFTTAAGSLLFSLRDLEWDKALALEYQVDPRRLARVLPAATVAGELAEEAAQDMGLPAGIPVATGAQDQKCAALAAGLEEGVVTVSLGTSTAISALVRRPVYDETMAVPCFPYLTKGSWVLEAPLVTTGGAVRWLRDLLRGFGAQTVDYAQLVALASTAPPGSRGVRCYPFLAGAGAPHWIPDSRGSLTGLGLETKPADVARAVLEGVAFEVRSALEAVRRLGVEVRHLRLFGGGARAHLWAQIMADVVRVPVERSADVERAVGGAAILAMVAAGMCGSLADGQKLLRGDSDWFEPDAEEPYEAAYEDYCATRDSLWRTLRRARSG